MENKEFVIPFSGLKEGNHRFEYHVENTFFESFDYNEFNGASISIDASFTKSATMMELGLEGKGTVNVDCDRSGEPFDLPIAAQLQMVIKFGEDFDDENDEILIIPHGEHQINIAQYVYEMLVLAVPQKRVHPGVVDGTLQSEMLDKLEELRLKEDKKESDTADPRWDGLKKLLTDK